MIRYSEDGEPHNDYRFEIVERIVVTIPQPRPGLLPRCTCTNLAARGLCKHLWWLLDRVAFELTTAAGTGNEHVELSCAGDVASLIRQDTTVHRQTVHSVLEQRIDDIARRHSWIEYASDEEEFRQSHTVGLFSLMDTQGLLPSEFAALDSADDNQPVQRYVQCFSIPLLTSDRRIRSRLLRNYVTAVLARAAHDTRIHERVKTLLGAHYDNVVLQKLHTRVTGIFHDFDLMRAGHNVAVHDVSVCAKRLWDTSASIGGLLRNRTGNIRPTPALRYALASLLLEIAQRVLETRGSAYVGFRPAFIESATGQDIFHYTIVQPPEERPDFVVSTLGQFIDVLDDALLDRIEHMAKDLEQTPAPLIYIDRLRSVAQKALARSKQDSNA